MLRGRGRGSRRLALAGRVPVSGALLLLAAPLLLVGLGAAPFDDPGEGMHAEIARDLASRGDPLDLRLAGVRYVDKPPLLYLLLAGAFHLAGPGEGTARLVPALAALAAVAAVSWHGGRLLGPPGGLLAGGALLTSTGFFAYGRYVRPETLFVAALAWGFALVLTGLDGGRRRLVAAGLACFGLAGLAKDPLGVLLPPLAVGFGLALGGRGRPLARWLPGPGVALALVLGLGWWVAVEARTPGFVWYTVVDNHLLNVARARVFPDEDVPLSAGEFLLVGLLAAAPWTLAAAVTVAGLVRRRAWRRPDEQPWVVLALWAVGVFLFTALSPFRLPHYGLPAYPAVALLAARAWQARTGPALPLAHAAGFAAAAGALGLLWSGEGAGLGGLLATTDVATRKAGLVASASPEWAGLRPLVGTAALILAAGAVALLAVSRARVAASLPAVVVVATGLALLPLVGQALALVSRHRAVQDLAWELRARAGPDDLLVHEGPLENSGALEWYAGRRPLILDGRRSVLAFGATRPDGPARFWEADDLWSAWPGPRRIWLVSVRPPERSVAGRLPGARLVAAGGGRRLWVNR